MASIGQNIRLFRKKKGWSQNRLGEETNIDYRKISLYETGRSTPSADILLLIANALDVTPNDLYGIVSNDDKLFQNCNAIERAYILELVAFVRDQFTKYIIG